MFKRGGEIWSEYAMFAPELSAISPPEQEGKATPYATRVSSWSRGIITSGGRMNEDPSGFSNPVCMFARFSSTGGGNSTSTPCLPPFSSFQTEGKLTFAPLLLAVLINNFVK